MNPTMHNLMDGPVRGGALRTAAWPVQGDRTGYRWYVAVVILLLCLVADAAEPLAARDLHIDLDDRLIDLEMEFDDHGELYIRVEDGERRHLVTPQDFARIIHREQEELRAKGLLFALFNITTWWGVLWVSVGLLGQLLFTFRMVLQWVASEREQRSVVPVAFWWGSLMGGAMLLTYFIWRKDIVGILGQSTGVFIYARNLWLIHAATGLASSVVSSGKEDRVA